METIGSLLKQEREKQNKRLNEVAEETRISKMVLEAIEEDRSEVLLPVSYIRGFLRLYAQVLGLDPAEMIQMYNEQLDGRGKWRPQMELKGQVSTTAAGPGTWIGFAAALAVCTILYFIMNANGPAGGRSVSIPESSLEILPDRGAPQRPETLSPEIPAAAEPAAAPADISVEAEPAVTPTDIPGEAAPAAADVISERFTVRFEAREMIWARLSADDGEPFEVLLRPGEIYRKSAARVLNVRIGNPGGLSLYFNGTPVELTGDPDKPVDLVFSKDAGKLQLTQ